MWLCKDCIMFFVLPLLKAGLSKMRKGIVTAALFLFTADVFAQQFTMRHDTIIVAGRVYGILAENGTEDQYFVRSPSGVNLCEIHYSHVYEKGRPMYVLTFLNDNKQAAIYKIKKSFVPAIVRYDLIVKYDISAIGELKYTKENPLPANYADVDS